VLRAEPEWLGALVNLGNVLQDAGRIAEAEACYRQVLAREPEAVEPLYNLARALHAAGRPDEARACLEKVVAILATAGDAHAREGRRDEALDCYQRVLQLRPDNLATLIQAGVLLDAANRDEEALALYRRALAVRPGDPEAALNLGLLLQKRGEYPAAIEAYDLALRTRPDHGEAALARALTLLTMGDYARGWPAYEVRYQGRFEYPRVTAPALDFPMWRGEPLAGRRILLVGEQGYGDQIQFIRYAAVLARQGAMVDVAADRRLARLFAGVPGVRNVVSGVPRDSRDYDCWSLLMSVPLHVGTTVDTVPGGLPYLTPPADDRRKWAGRLRALPEGRPRVGLVWSGRERPRSMAFENLLPLARLRGLSFVGLQFGDKAAGRGPEGFPALDLGAEVGDFADQAALIANLDLLLTVDTAVVHVAAAMGSRVWIMMPFNPDWRWLARRADSPWYPSVRIYRQERLGDWASLVERVARDLEDPAIRPAAGKHRPA
jgi:tetratricopeptide (TPR) repeat protein